MARQAKSKVKSMLIIFFDIKGIVRKKFVLAGQTVNFTYYCNVLRLLRENVRIFRPELWRQKLVVASRQRTVSDFPFHQAIFDKKKIDCLPPILLFSVSPIEDKTERPPFWHN
jgi:hypothetical protein